MNLPSGICKYWHFCPLVPVYVSELPRLHFSPLETNRKSRWDSKGDSGSTKAGTGVVVGLRRLSPSELLPLLLQRLKWFLSAQTCWAGLYLSRCLSSGESPQCEQFDVQSWDCFLWTPGRLYLGTASAGTWQVHTHPGAPHTRSPFP